MILVAGGSGGAKSGGAASPAGAQLLASTASGPNGPPVDGIQCQRMEQAVFHIHAHLAVFVDRHQRLVPEGIGIPEPRSEQQTTSGPFVTAGECLYWLHSHTRDGIIHIESPVERTYTLGDYFDLWHQPLTRSQVGPASGAVTAYVNGRRFAGDPRSIPLTAHALVQLDVGAPVAPVGCTFPSGL